MSIFSYIIYFFLKGNISFLKRFSLITNFTVFCFLFFIKGHAQGVEAVGNPGVISFSRNLYQAQRQNWSVSQSPVTGYMYFANTKGLLEYDGGRWRIFSFPQIIRSVYVSKKGEIFTGALGEFGKWEPDSDGELKYHSLKHLIKGGEFSQEAIWNIIETRQGILFQSFAFAYLYQSNDKIKSIKTPSNILYFSQLGQKTYLPVIEGGIFEFTDPGFTELPGTKQFLSGKAVTSILDGGNGSILVGTLKGVFKYKNGQFNNFSSELNQLLFQFQLNKAFRIGNKLVFGTLLNGLIITDENGKVLHIINKNHGLPNNTVLALTADSEGNLWAGLDNGIGMINLKSPLRHFHDIDGNLGAVYDVVIFNERLYVGTNHGVFFTSLNDSQAKFQLISNTQGQVWSLDVFDNQLICGHNEGTFLIEGTSATKISSITGGWVIKRLKKQPDVLIQGTYTKLIFYKKDIKGIWQLSHELGDFSDPVRQIEEDSEGIVWINKVSRGISGLKLSNDLHRIISHIDFKSNLMLENGVNMSYFSDTLWFNTSKGVCFLDKNENSIKLSQLYLTKPNLIKFFPGIGNYPISLQSNATLWLHNRNEHRSVSYFENRSFVEGSENIKLLNNEHIVFCLEDGFAIAPKLELFRPILKTGKEASIRAVSVEGKPELNQVFNPNFQKTVSLSYNENSFEIQFAPNIYFQSIQYSYFLEGYSKSWSTFQTEPYKWFYNIPPGSYTFLLKSNNSDKVSRLEIFIRPPWYWNFWSKTFYILMSIGALVSLNKLHLTNLKKQNRLLQEKHQKEVEKQQQEIIRIRNEQLEADVIRKSEELANSTMTLIKRNELLGRLKDQVASPNQKNVASSEFQRLINTIDQNLSSSHDWRVFETNFNQVHESFLKKLTRQFPDLSHGDLKLAAYLRMNLSTKEIAQLLNITVRGVELKRYRLRKKLGIETEENLSDFMIKL